MRELANFVHRAKHWQMFLLIFGGAFGPAAVMLSFSEVDSQSLRHLGESSILALLVTAIAISLFQGWLWTLGSFLHSLTQPSLRLPLNFFRFSVVYPAIYLFVALQLFEKLNAILFLLILPLHLFAMFCLLYNLYFVSKSLVLAETGRAASFLQILGPFFLVLYFPVGIWFIQPRINRLYERNMKRIPDAG